MIRTLIVDDEPIARKTLRIHLQDLPGFAVVGERGDGGTAVDAIRELAPDLVFLDIRMPDMSGFDVLRQLEPEELPYVVFVTAYDAYALQAFEVNAIAYLLKPFDDIRFDEVVDRCRRFFRDAATKHHDHSLAARIRTLLDSEPSDPATDATTFSRGDDSDRIVVRSGNRVRFVRSADVDWIEAEGNYARLHCRDGGSHLVGRPLGDVGAALDPTRFVRIHRSSIVNIDRVKELRTENYRDFTVLLEGGHQLRLSRTYRADFERAVGGRI